ncbi:DNA polymerase III subunit delta [Desulfotruncus alcoholivorax]|uniref:DNA polymerase III subunit delta n=1 Tax=Desulfotruncus alcoholivorax TaxID=265477 RepID=UPI0004078492|nr:DNA polymerase III subunit delta [Desulfotruncus alcoholivorax]
MKYFIDFLNVLKQGKIALVYLFYGPEAYLRDQALMRLKQTLFPSGEGDFNYEVLDGSHVPVAEVIAAVELTPLTAGRKLVVVRDAAILQKDADDKQILEYLERPNKGCCLVFETRQSIDRRKKLYKKIATMGGAIEFTRLKTPDLTKWLAKQAREEGAALTREAAEELLLRCGPDMYTLHNEMQKLACFVGTGNTINMDTVKELVASRVEESIFEMVDAIGEKDGTRAIEGIRQLLRQKQQPQQIIGMIARQFRLLYQVQGMIEAGTAREEIIKTLRMHPFVYKKISLQHKNFSSEQLVRTIMRLADLDYLVKTGGGNFSELIETFILKLCFEK